MQRAIFDIRQRGVFIANETMERAAAQSQQTEPCKLRLDFRHLKFIAGNYKRAARTSSIDAPARSGPAGANAAALLLSAVIRDLRRRHLRARSLRISRQKLIGNEPAVRL